MIPERYQPRAERFHFLPREKVTGGTLPWIVALMVLLAVLGLAAGVSLASGVWSMGAGLESGFTVQIVEPNPDLKADKVAAVTAILEDDTEISGIRVLSDADLTALVEPWLGTGNVGEDLPLPAMIDAEAANDRALARVRQQLDASVESARIDDHARWLAPIGKLAWVLAISALTAALLVLAAMAAIVVLSVRAGLGRHAETINVLHLIGAEDSVITHLFEYRFAVTAALGAAVGFLIAMALFLIIDGLLAGVSSGLAALAGLPWWGWILVLLVPVIAVLLSVITARITVERALKKAL
ncbi:hypothetical protein KCG44_02555 [Pacificimonas sp. WHA3]|uniref:Cell division protein FtsX n=1 Tax=Pacificimonas pallii TaxID=2827236 RepID=A0ABS6SC44_9SPHN|nr:hypothetical protein [Pacificimonas pallii]MBV7255663.1 hypothetical protein [Pacificimonas pallii]